MFKKPNDVEQDVLSWDDLHDKRWGRFLFCFKKLTTELNLTLTTISEEDQLVKANLLHVVLFGIILRVLLPFWIKPKLIEYDGSYVVGPDIIHRRYGFSLHAGLLTLFYGLQFDLCGGGDSKKSTYRLPFSRYEYIRHSIMDLNGKHEMWRTRLRGLPYHYARTLAPYQVFLIEDYDGEHIHAHVIIEETERRRDPEQLTWLTPVIPISVKKRLTICYSSEFKNSGKNYKDGLIEHSIPFRSDDTAEKCFTRYCSEKGIRCVGLVETKQFYGAAHGVIEGQVEPYGHVVNLGSPNKDL